VAAVALWFGWRGGAGGECCGDNGAVQKSSWSSWRRHLLSALFLIRDLDGKNLVGDFLRLFGYIIPPAARSLQSIFLGYRDGVVLHPQGLRQATALEHVFWNETKGGAPLAESGALGGIAFVATQSAHTGELQLRAAKIPELISTRES
jgi:hypothetical protein